MASYKIDDVLNCLSDMKKDGFEYIDLSIVEADDDIPESLCIDAISPDSINEQEFIDSVEIPNDYFMEL